MKKVRLGLDLTCSWDKSACWLTLGLVSKSVGSRLPLPPLTLSLSRCLCPVQGGLTSWEHTVILAMGTMTRSNKKLILGIQNTFAFPPIISFVLTLFSSICDLPVCKGTFILHLKTQACSYRRSMLHRVRAVATSRLLNCKPLIHCGSGSFFHPHVNNSLYSLLSL